jgi:hypothetical protein
LGQAYKRLGQTDKAMAEYELFEKLKSARPADEEKQGIVQFLVELKK